MLNRLRTPLLVAIGAVCAIITLLLSTPLFNTAEGVMPNLTTRTYWGVLAWLRVTVRVEFFGPNEATQTREFQWNFVTLAITLVIVVVMWSAFYLLMKKLRRRAKPQA